MATIATGERACDMCGAAADDFHHVVFRPERGLDACEGCAAKGSADPVVRVGERSLPLSEVRFQAQELNDPAMHTALAQHTDKLAGLDAHLSEQATLRDEREAASREMAAMAKRQAEPRKR